jgi:hypothetical protein
MQRTTLVHRVRSTPIAAALFGGALALHAACGGSTSAPRQTPPGDDVGDDLGDDVGCVSPSAGEVCTQGQTACPDYVDSCAEPYTWVCTATRGWELVAPAACSGGDSGTGDGGCIDPTEGAACTSQQAACQPSDPCCAGYVWGCTGTPATWQKLGLGCTCPIEAGVDAGPFACGSVTCSGGQFCEVQPPGIASADGGTPPTGYTCVFVPPACAASPTCSCIESTLSPSDTCSTHIPGVSCMADGEGHVTIDCIGE